MFYSSEIAAHKALEEKARDEFAKIEKMDVDLTQEGKRKAELRKQRKAEQVKLTKENSKLQNDPEDNEKEIAKLQKTIEATEKEIEKRKSELDQVLASLTQETQVIQTEKDKEEAELSEVKAVFNEKRAAVSVKKIIFE